MSSMKQLYTDYYNKLVKVLPMKDRIFLGYLHHRQFLSDDAMQSIAARTTRAERAAFFLDNYIEKGFDDDESNPLFLELLKLMQESDDLFVKSVAHSIYKQSTVLLVIIIFVDIICILCRYDAYKCGQMFLHVNAS